MAWKSSDEVDPGRRHEHGDTGHHAGNDRGHEHGGVPCYGVALPGHDVWVMLTYCLGQGLIVVAVAHHDRIAGFGAGRT